MLGINNPDAEGKLRIELYAILTLLVILFINVVYELYILLPTMPTAEQFYGIFIKALFTALSIWAINRGLQWRKTQAIQHE